MKILAIAYACQPGSGSEPGAGWAWARMLTRLGTTYVITRENNRKLVETEAAGLPERDLLHFEFVDLPKWACFWKRGQRGVRLYYMLWQAAAFARAWHLRKEVQFDLVWHLTLANAWLGSIGCLVGLPFVYGPVGGAVKVPSRLLASLGIRGVIHEILRSSARFVCRYLNPLARMAWRRASIILAQNRETIRWLPKVHRHKAYVFPNVVVDIVSGRNRRAFGTYSTALVAGRLLPLKGITLALRAVASRSDWKLLVCGSGPDEKRLRNFTRRMAIQDRVEFLGPLPRSRLLELMRRDADVYLSPSLHEEAGWTIAEALSAGLPVIHLDMGGPSVICGDVGVAVAATNGISATASLLSAALDRAKLITCQVAQDQAVHFLMDNRVKGLLVILKAHVGSHEEDT